ncbi:MAG: potassium transporter Kup [Candidatus Rokubacteria bacterium]|nr:potassium transporter Kup [Candidatus Rokubacteria bacterium]
MERPPEAADGGPPEPPAPTPPPPPSTARISPKRHVDTVPEGRRLLRLSLIALGVVYGDIGTSPLYAFREAFNPEYGLPPTRAVVYGVLSLMVWSLILVVTVKYIALVLRADNRGEGGILALLALVPRNRAVLVMLGLFGAALLYGDGIITPAISVLGAAEGLEVVAPAFHPYVVPFALVVLLALFLVQKRGTAGVGRVFGPIVLLWFVTIATLGAVEILRHPGVLVAFNPWYGARLFWAHGTAAFFVLGAVVLTVTGAEALYADMGHFGRRPIRVAWFAAVLPALLLNYFGQGALLVNEPAAVANPFYLLAPRWFLYPLLAIATLAAIVASQALISGAFSLAQQTIQLGFSPRLTIIHTSRSEYGQIYIPEVNVALMVGCLLLVVGFRTSSALGAAYGIAVTATMAITTALFYVVARHRWHWSFARAGSLAALFLTIELAFLGANVVKVAHGGWVPLVIAGGVFLLMTTWRRGTRFVVRIVSGRSVPLDRFFTEVAVRKPPRVPGTAVFLTAHTDGTPEILRHHLRHNKVLHEEVVFLSLTADEIPEVPERERFTIKPLGDGFYRVIARYGFMETPDVRALIARCCTDTLRADPDDISYYLGRPQVLPTGPSQMAKWRKLLFAFMARNARSATQFFNIPRDRVVELGMQIEV